MPKPAAKSSYYRRAFFGPPAIIPEITSIGFGRFPHARPGNLLAHSHAGDFEICYLLSGAVEWWDSSGLAEVRPGDLYFTFPGEIHGGVDTVMHGCELYWITLPIPPVFNSSFRDMRCRVFKGSPLVHACFQAIFQEHLSPSHYAPQFLLAKRDELLVQIIRAYRQYEQTQSIAPASQPIRKALAYLQEHANQDIAADSAAAVAGLRSSRFHERFAAETGFTPLEYHARIRLLRARQLLTQTRRPITRVAFDLGFSSSQYFATVFKNHVGLTPRDYRAKHRQGNAR